MKVFVLLVSCFLIHYGTSISFYQGADQWMKLINPKRHSGFFRFSSRSHTRLCRADCSFYYFGCFRVCD
ncbi:hypothetical protein GCK32_019976 [Trichostrongylus colubriformis]|uniref:Uncharacterized protein n=1 Tax=Trichostrongylus colubriformis TaxID=6319 RepID=A0AAN8EVW8_TRICO